MNMINKSIDSILINLNQQMSTWIEDSEISLFNKSLSVTPYKISDDFYYVLQQGEIINQKTDGAFDYTIYPIADLWGFGPNSDNNKTNPENSEILSEIITIFDHVIFNQDIYVTCSSTDGEMNYYIEL